MHGGQLFQVIQGDRRPPVGVGPSHELQPPHLQRLRMLVPERPHPARQRTAQLGRQQFLPPLRLDVGLVEAPVLVEAPPQLPRQPKPRLDGPRIVLPHIPHEPSDDSPKFPNPRQAPTSHARRQ
ncbi:hypothetical protein [Paractinoplanes lichenicola]|uniref:Uncharacterized protein n=1 Tax=Paractinoplanes lichenicola TaxID=2802976 RepID=A0ABS1VWP1_9ACTN|nr:hypothetical protein [Actinoplanes lichenicola]MBL7258907.1 hypothetical protein [Actinoplanes lichenicola]